MPPCRHGYHCVRPQCLRSGHEGHCGRPQRRLPGTSAIAYSRNAFGAEKRPIAYARNGLGAELRHTAEVLTAILASESRCGGQKFHAAFHAKGITNEFSPKTTLKKTRNLLTGTPKAFNQSARRCEERATLGHRPTDETPHGVYDVWVGGPKVDARASHQPLG